MTHDEAVESIGQRLRDARHLRGQSQQAAAVAMGVSLIAVSKWECENRHPTGLYRNEVERYIRLAREAARRHQRMEELPDETTNPS